ncbi:MAG: diacylglycerol kinase family protein [Ferruginibacter sp.]
MKLIKSFVFAWQGLQFSFRTQLNFRIHLLTLLVTIFAGFIFRISSTEWLFIIVCAMLVLVLELINTCIELLCDIITKDIHPVIKIIKDVSAAAVLVAASGSVITGIIIFLPKIFNLF